MDANTKISAMIVAEMARNGGNVKAAIDAVIGPGTYEKLAADLYDALRLKK